MAERVIASVSAGDIYARKERQMRDALLEIIDNIRQNREIIDDPDLQQTTELAANALNDLEWIDAHEQGTDARKGLQ
ncbi:hypothetical protein [Schleiferilactobacillus harbinensis]|uniref:Uncharacterized protein n=1 Tax=Schleiferilactobacillus harbinensis TaxID=304207 RepID=A0A5P8M3W2_9LACO|nr:hypothetical protein [Schleiferilactobacillus harbinensis]QFR23198.1 hypothetical protein D1010_07170 [Schleiferilactobacillus harbinensis]